MATDSALLRTDSAPAPSRPVERGRLAGVLCFVLGFLAPLWVARLPSANLTAFDLLVFALFFLWATMPKARAWAVGYRQGAPLAFGGFLTLVGLVLGAFRAPDGGAALMHVVQWVFIVWVVLPTCVALFDRPSRVVVAAAGMALAMSVVGLVGMREVLFFDKPYRAYRYGSVYGDPQLAGFNVAVALPFLVLSYRAAVRHLRSWWLRMGARAGIAAVVLVLLVFLARTLSRSGWVAGLVGLASYAVWTAVARRITVERLLKTALLLLVVALGVGVYVARFAPEEVLDRIEQTRSLSSPEVADRTDGYVEVFDIGWTYFLVGTGGDNYQHYSPRGQKPHDVPLLLLVEAGVIGMIGFLVVFGYAFFSAVGRLRAGPSWTADEVRSAVLASLCATAVILAFNASWTFRGYWFVVGLALATARWRAPQRG